MKRRELLRSMVALAVGSALIPASMNSEARVNRAGRHAAVHNNNRNAFHSVGGVRRRTRRRTRRRVHRHQRLYSLPYGCSTTHVRGGATYYYCGGIWYRPTYQGTTVIYIVEEIETGADTNVEFEE